MNDYSTNQTVPIVGYSSNQNQATRQSFGESVVDGGMINGGERSNHSQQLIQDRSSKGSKSDDNSSDDSDASSESGSEVKFV